MEFVPIFGTTEKFWCPVFDEDNGVDLFTILMDKWTDTEYLTQFINANNADLASPYWNGINRDEAIKLILAEVYYLQEKLICIEDRHPACDDVQIEDLFEKFNKNELIFKGNDQRDFVKAKMDSYPKFLRLYGIELEDGTIVISGGAIKLSFELDRQHIKDEIRIMEGVGQFLKSEMIYTKNGLV